MVANKIKGWIIKCGQILGILACLPIFIYLLLLGASHVYVSSNGIEELFSSNPVWEGIESLDLPGLSEPGPIRVERVGAFHAIRNAIFILCIDALIALFPFAALLCLLLGIILILTALFTADWTMFIGGIWFGIVTPLLIIILGGIVVVLFPIVFWLVLFFQPCTPAYVILWIVLGLPFAALGIGGGAAPSATIITIVNPGVVEVVIRDK